MKITYRDAFFFMGGIVIGFSLIFIWIEIMLVIVSNNILPHIQIQAVNFNINETTLIEAMNKTIAGIRR